MKCFCCHKKLGMINCKGCKGTFCSGCIQLENHACTGLESIRKQELQKLANNMPVVCAAKIEKF